MSDIKRSRLSQHGSVWSADVRYRGSESLASRDGRLAAQWAVHVARPCQLDGAGGMRRMVIRMNEYIGE